MRYLSAMIADPTPEIPELPPGQDELPYEDGMPLETEKHREQMNLLIDVLRTHLGPEPGLFFGGNLGVYFSVLQARNRDFLVPDFFVAEDSQPGRRRKSWVMWEEDGHAPLVVIELLSDSTEAIDRGRKMDIYAGLRVASYYLFDPTDLRFEGYALRADRTWERMVPDNGLLPCAPLGLALAVRPGTYLQHTDDWLRWCTPDGRVLPTAEEAGRERAEAEREQADVERERADAERERADAERKRAEAERERAEAERERAEAERERAERLAAKLRAMGIDSEGV
jgi:Uma2 family endonuclease